MMSNEKFGVMFIRVKIDGYLKNITENEIMKIDTKGIKNKNKITYNDDSTKNIIKAIGNEIVFVRESDEFINTFRFKNNDKCTSSYFLKENGCDFEIDIDVISAIWKENLVLINYKVIDSDCNYEYKIEVSEIL